MVSFTNHYNAISIDRLSSKTKIGKDSWKRFMKIIILCKPEFSSATKSSILLKTQKSHSSASDWWEYTKYCFKENDKIFSKNSTSQDLYSFKENARTFSNSFTTQENITISEKN